MNDQYDNRIHVILIKFKYTGKLAFACPSLLTTCIESALFQLRVYTDLFCIIIIIKGFKFFCPLLQSQVLALIVFTLHSCCFHFQNMVVRWMGLEGFFPPFIFFLFRFMIACVVIVVLHVWEFALQILLFSQKIHWYPNWKNMFRFRFFIHQVLQQGKCLENGKHTDISKQ